MVTLKGTQNFSEFELHARAILGLPVKEISLIQNGASWLFYHKKTQLILQLLLVLKVSQITNTDVRILESSYINRRMGVALLWTRAGRKID